MIVAKIVLGAVGAVVGIWGLALLIDLVVGRNAVRGLQEALTP